jgi:hypothetical protein
MSQISDKTRKILWGRSGNRCAICKHELIIDSNDKDSDAIVGDECHIISSQKNGPRYDPSYPEEKLDSYENLILLCRVHHKMIDDQAITYSPDILRQIKSNHEVMISEKLSGKQKIKPVRLRRVKKNIPDYLVHLTTGKQVVEIISGTYAFSMDHDELDSQEEVDVVGGFIQVVNDWAEIIDDIEPGGRVDLSYKLTKLIHELEEKGFYIFGGREVQFLEGGIQDEPTAWPVAIIHVLRNDNKTIIHPQKDAQ